MISDDQHSHRARLDSDGNIILPEEVTSSHVPVEEKKTIRESRIPKASYEETAPKRDWTEIRDRTLSATHDLLSEGACQYKCSFFSLRSGLRSGKTGLRRGAKTLYGFLLQPVWIPRKDKSHKEYSRLTLFLLDTARFGGTFAALFVALFVSLNYQSFWQIVRPHLDPIEYSQSTNALGASLDDQLRDKLLKSPTLAVAGNNGDLLSFLPSVGPMENRIIIPKLNVNIPLVTPSYEALLNEDWGKVEEDIQDALQIGVVHYPGTARPGQAGNFFVTGHSSYYPWAPGKYKTIFARLHELSVGDEYWVYYGGDKHRYVIESKKEVRPTDVSVLDQPVNKRTGTLMTCTPVGTTLRRLILNAEEVDPVNGTPLKVGERESRETPRMNVDMLPI
jgi:LPXTG-site transpeptidase (sortase) family protein